MANKINTVLYTGFSSILPGRVLVHKDKVVEGFTKKYNVNKLVYYETCDSREGALWREKQIKAGSRQDKMELINSVNPKWEDLSDKL
jgi:putative endonuclease